MKAFSIKYPWTVSDPESSWAYGNCEGDSWINEFPEGWWIAFGEQMISDIDAVLRKYDCMDKFEIHQIKEKYGELRFYFGNENLPCNAVKELHEIVRKYEELSRYTCIKCGKPAEYITKGWIIPVCKECCNDIDKCSKNPYFVKQ